MRRTSHKRSHINKKQFQNAEDSEDDDAVEDEFANSIWSSRNCIYYHAPVTTQSVSRFVRVLAEAELEALTYHMTIFLFIHSSGGDCYAGLSAMDHIKNCRVHVTTIADGFVASAATFMLLGGDDRFGMGHCSILIHQLSTGFFGKYEELVEEMENSQKLMTTIRSLYLSSTNMSEDTLNQLLKSDVVHDFNAAIDLGLITKKYSTRKFTGHVCSDLPV